MFVLYKCSPSKISNNSFVFSNFKKLAVSNNRPLLNPSLSSNCVLFSSLPSSNIHTEFTQIFVESDVFIKALCMIKHADLFFPLFSEFLNVW